MPCCDDKDEITLNNKVPNFNDITLKGSEKGSVSTAELMTPKRKKDTFSFNPAHFQK